MWHSIDFDSDLTLAKLVRTGSGSWGSYEAGDLTVGRGWPVTSDTWHVALPGDWRGASADCPHPHIFLLDLVSTQLPVWFNYLDFHWYWISTVLIKCDPYIKTCDDYHIECHIVDILQLQYFLSHCNSLHFNGWFLTGVHWNMDTSN